MSLVEKNCVRDVASKASLVVKTIHLDCKMAEMNYMHLIKNAIFGLIINQKGSEMSEIIKHECGIATVRLRKPLIYYKEKYGTIYYGLNKLYLLMEKQHNRGQEGAGLACVKMNAEPGDEYIFRERAMGSGAIQEIFAAVHEMLAKYPPGQLSDVDWVDKHLPFIGEMYMGHLRYSTTGQEINL